MLCVTAVHSPPITHWPGTCPAVGWASLQLCLWSQFHRLWGCIFFASGFCSLMGEVGLEISGGRGSPLHTGWCWSLTFWWWVGLCSCAVGCLAWVTAALESTGCLVGPGLGVNVPSKMSAFRQVLPDMFTAFISQERVTVTSPTSQWDPSRPAGRSGSGSHEVTASALDPRAHGDLVYILQE